MSQTNRRPLFHYYDNFYCCIRFKYGPLPLHSLFHSVENWSQCCQITPPTPMNSPYLTLPYLTLPYLTLPYLTLPYLTLPYLTFGVGRLLHLPSAEAVSVRPNAQPRCNQRSQSSAVKPKHRLWSQKITSHLGLVTCSMVVPIMLSALS